MAYKDKHVMGVTRKLRSLYAKIEFDAGEGEASQEYGIYEIGSKYGELPDAELEGKTFLKWVDADGATVTKDSTVGDSQTLYAVYITRPSEQYFYLMAEEAGSTDVKIMLTGYYAPELNLEYSLDGGEWTNYTVNQNIQLNGISSYVSFRATDAGNPQGTGGSLSRESFNFFYFTKKVYAGGNIMSLLNKNGTAQSIPDYGFFKLFTSRDALTHAPLIDYTTVKTTGYPCGEMFLGCSNLSSVIVGRNATSGNLYQYNWTCGCKEPGFMLQPTVIGTHSTANRGSGNLLTSWVLMNYGETDDDPYIMDCTGHDYVEPEIMAGALPTDHDYVIKVKARQYYNYTASSVWNAHLDKIEADAEHSFDISDGETKLSNYVIGVGDSAPMHVLKDNWGYTLECNRDYSYTINGSTQEVGQLVYTFTGIGSYSGTVTLTCDVVLPENITKIYYSDGKPTRNISKTSITWSDVGKSSNSESVNISKVEFGKNVQRLEDYAFYNQSSSMKSQTLVLPQNITYIGNNCFNNTSLPYISLMDYTDPDNVAQIQSKSFKTSETHQVSAYSSEMVDAFKTAGWDQSYYVFHYQVEVQFDAGEGMASESSRRYFVNQAYGSFPTATREGWYFTGWYDSDGNQVKISDSPTGATTLYAQWSDTPAQIDYLTFTATADSGAQVQFSNGSAALEYSLDGTTWNSYTLGQTITLAQNESVKFRGENETFQYTTFTSTGDVEASGSIMTLLDPADQLRTVPTRCFNGTFQNVQALKRGPDLPAAQLGSHAYEDMFKDSGIEDAACPAAVILEGECYRGLYANCTSLKTLRGSLPTPTSAAGGLNYSWMFENCTSLEAITVDWDSWFSSNDLHDWVVNVTQSGTFKCPASLGTQSSIRRGSAYCPSNFTVENI